MHISEQYFIFNQNHSVFHNFMMGFVVSLHVFASSFDKVIKLFILFCLHPTMAICHFLTQFNALVYNNKTYQKYIIDYQYF